MTVEQGEQKKTASSKNEILRLYIFLKSQIIYW